MRTLDCASDWEFFARGNANLVYRYVGQLQELHNKLLRLRLEGQEYDTKEVYEFVESKVRSCIKEVAQMDIVRVKFHMDEALNDGFGLLMPNILPHNSKSVRKEKYFEVFESKDITTIQIKPKWLGLTSRGCRNCAHHTLKHGKEPSFCSFGLLDTSMIKKTVATVSEENHIQMAMESYLCGNDSVFKVLASLQKDIDLSALTDQTQADPGLCFQMTLRDVTVFLTVKHTKVTNVTVTDVDPKSPSKWQSWLSTEKKLISQNLYSFHSENYSFNDETSFHQQ